HGGQREQQGGNQGEAHPNSGMQLIIARSLWLEWPADKRHSSDHAVRNRRVCARIRCGRTVPPPAICAITAPRTPDAIRYQTGGEMLDLGIKGRKAIVCAASKGLGRACATALARAGVEVTITARTAETLEETAAEIRRDTGATVTAVAGDITTEAGRAAALAACPEPDILVNNAGGPPHGDFRDWAIEDWQKAVNGNMLTPIMLIKATVDGM